MGRLTMAGALLSVALGSALALPAAAQAATSAPTAGIARMAASAGHHAAVPDIPPGSQWEFFGLTYPDTSAGLAACNEEGSYLHRTVPNQDLSWKCSLNDPDSGYNLWILFVSPE
jgi:hypothetical protein